MHEFVSGLGKILNKAIIRVNDFIIKRAYCNNIVLFSTAECH